MTTDFVEAELKEDMTSYLKMLDSLPLHPHHKVSVITKYIIANYGGDYPYTVFRKHGQYRT